MKRPAWSSRCSAVIRAQDLQNRQEGAAWEGCPKEEGGTTPWTECGSRRRPRQRQRGSAQCLQASEGTLNKQNVKTLKCLSLKTKSYQWWKSVKPLNNIKENLAAAGSGWPGLGSCRQDAHSRDTMYHRGHQALLWLYTNLNQVSNLHTHLFFFLSLDFPCLFQLEKYMLWRNRPSMTSK